MFITERFCHYISLTVFYKTLNTSRHVFAFMGNCWNFVLLPINDSIISKLMCHHVIGLRSQFKVLYPIIELVTIFVVNYFKRKWFKFSTKMLLHNRPVFQNTKTIIISNTIVPKRCNSSLSSEKASALTATRLLMFAICYSFYSVAETAFYFVPSNVHLIKVYSKVL